MKYVIIALIVIVCMIAVWFLTLKYGHYEEQNFQYDIVLPTPKPTPPGPKIVIEDKGMDKFVQISPYELSFTIPSTWTIKGYPYNESIVNDVKEYSGTITMNDGYNNRRLTLIVNHQGDFCPGPSSPKVELLPNRFNLPARKILCEDPIYFYGDLDKPGSVIPNLFIRTSGLETSEMKKIIDSIQYAI